MNSAAFLILLLAYSVALVAVGLVLARRVRTSSDFFVAGRQLSSGLVFTTFLAANIGAGSTVGAAGLGYSIGLSAWWWVGSAGIGSLLLAFCIGPRIYRLSRDHHLLTVGDFLEFRYSRTVRTVFAVVLWLGALSILAGQLIAIAWILNVAAGVPKPAGCALGGMVVTAYFTAGGLWSSAWVNLVQLTVKMAGFIIAVPWALARIGGWENLHARLAPTAAAATVPSADLFSPFGAGPNAILGFAVILIPSFIVSPGLIQKLYGARDERAVRRGIAAQGAALLSYAALPAVLGMIALAAFPHLANRELALPLVMRDLLPGWLGALLLAAVFSAEISAADAVLFMLSTSLAKDLYQSLSRPLASDRALLGATRWAAAGSGFAAILAAIALPSIIDALTIFYGLLAVVLFVPLLAGLYSNRPRAGHALAAMVLAALATVIVYAWTHGGGWSIFPPYAIGIAVSAAIMLLALFSTQSHVSRSGAQKT